MALIARLVKLTVLVIKYLIGQFAAGAGKKAGEFYTPQQASNLVLLKPILWLYFFNYTRAVTWELASSPQGPNFRVL